MILWHVESPHPGTTPIYAHAAPGFKAAASNLHRKHLYTEDEHPNEQNRQVIPVTHLIPSRRATGEKASSLDHLLHSQASRGVARQINERKGIKTSPTPRMVN